MIDPTAYALPSGSILKLQLSRLATTIERRELRRDAGTLSAVSDVELAGIYTDACGAALSCSQEARDAGDDALAFHLAKVYGRLEHLANSLRDLSAR